MAINTFTYAKVFQQALDEQMTAGATSGWMEENAGQIIYNGGNEVKIPKISMDGLADYDRDKGFTQGAITLDYESCTMTQDRARTFMLDSQDVDESNFVANASNIMSGFQKQKVIPEVDAYRYSRIYALAKAAGHYNTTAYTPAEATILQKLLDDVAAIQDEIGENEPLVITMPMTVAAILERSEAFQKIQNTAEFSQGNVFLKVKAIDGNPIIKVPSARMKTAYTFNDGITTGQTGGGFTPAQDAKGINWIICPRSVPLAVSKTDKMRIFTPEQNQSADAWKIDYRKYHDLWIADNKLAGVRVNIG